MRHKYEFYYNVEYAQEHNPTLMRFGLTGGFGCIRASMVKAVKGGDMVKAEKLFWQLMHQSLVEAKQEEEYIGVGSLDELYECWFDYLLEPDQEDDERFFVRPAQEDSKWQVMYEAFRAKADS